MAGRVQLVTQQELEQNASRFVYGVITGSTIWVSFITLTSFVIGGWQPGWWQLNGLYLIMNFFALLGGDICVVEGYKTAGRSQPDPVPYGLGEGSLAQVCLQWAVLLLLCPWLIGRTVVGMRKTHEESPRKSELVFGPPPADLADNPARVEIERARELLEQMQTLEESSEKRRTVHLLEQIIRSGSELPDKQRKDADRVKAAKAAQEAIALAENVTHRYAAHAELMRHHEDEITETMQQLDRRPQLQLAQIPNVPEAVQPEIVQE